MEKNLREVFSSWLARELPELVERDYPVELSKNIIAIIGPRRAGKTYFLFQVAKTLMQKGFAKDNIAYVDFEDIRLKKLKPEDYSSFVKVLHEIFKEKGKKIVLLLDEVQNLEGWQDWVRSLHNARNYYIFISGSSSKLSAREIPTQLRGRYISRLILPLSFEQFLRFKGFEPKHLEAPEVKGKMFRLLNEYLAFGGFPEVVQEREEKRKVELLRTYKETIFYRDVVERFRVRDVSSLEAFFSLLMENFGKYISLSKLEKYFKSLGIRKSKKTLANYLKYLESAFFIFLVEKMGKAKERVLQPRKVYPIDLGFCRLVPKLSKEKGVLVESIVAREFFKNTFYDPTIKVFYWKDLRGKEIDFVLQQGTKVKQLVQVTYASALEEIKKERIKILVEASKELRCKNLLVITWEYEGKERLKNRVVKFMPLWKWLLKRSQKLESS